MIESSKIVPITRLQKELTQTVRELSESGEPVYIIKNNSMKAVLVPFETYEYLSKLEDMFEYFEIDEHLKDRLRNYDPKNNMAWEAVQNCISANRSRKYRNSGYMGYRETGKRRVL